MFCSLKTKLGTDKHAAQAKSTENHQLILAETTDSKKTLLPLLLKFGQQNMPLSRMFCANSAHSYLMAQIAPHQKKVQAPFLATLESDGMKSGSGKCADLQPAFGV